MRQTLLARLSGARVLCVGDVMVDRFVYGDVTRVSPEAPIPVLLVTTPLFHVTANNCGAYATTAVGGTLVLMRKFDAAHYLQLAQQHGATHTMLVPVQYQRLMDCPTFDSTDLSRLRHRFCTSAPFSARLKAEVLRRWPGRLIEYYGLTEGGVRCELHCHEHPDKLHTVGRPANGSDVRLIDEQGQLYAKTNLGPARMDDRDLLALSDVLTTQSGLSLLDVLEVKGTETEITLQDATGRFAALQTAAPLARIHRADAQKLMDFIANPTH